MSSRGPGFPTTVTFGGFKDESGKKKYVRVDWVTLFAVILAGATLGFLWAQNIQTIVIRGLFYTSCILLFCVGVVRFSKFQMTLRYQFSFVIVGMIVGFVMMQSQVQDFLSQQTGIQLVYGYGLTDFTGGIVASPILITAVFLAAILFLIFVGPKVRRKAY